MQVCALDCNEILVFAIKAAKQCDYLCLECRGVVRLRSGFYRQPHFYHLRPNPECRLHGKGIVHLMIQHAILSKLPDGEAQLECRFDSINRIADVAWHPQKIVYEIQCSPISAQEVKERNAAYGLMGYQVVWILHDKRYNQFRLTAAEDFLCRSPHYFTNIDMHGEGTIYDQFSRNQRNVRVHRLPPLTIDLTQPKRFSKNEVLTTNPFMERIRFWQLGFAGDCVDRSLSLDEEWIEECQKLLKKQRTAYVDYLKTVVMRHFYRWVALPYKAVLRLFLERSCR